MSGSVAKYDTHLFGMSLARMGIDAASAVDFLDATRLNAIELPFECFMNSDVDFRRRFRAQKYKAVICGGIMDDILTAHIPFTEESERKQYQKEFRKNLLELYKRKIAWVALNFDMQAVLADADATAHALEMIRGLQPILMEYQITLLLTGALPALHNLPAGTSVLAKFLRDTMSPYVKLALELNLPDIPMDSDWTTLFGPLVWELKHLVFSYNADSGYHVSIEQVRTILAFLAHYRFRGPFMIAPRSSHNRMAFAEFDYFHKMVGQLLNE